MAAAPPACCPPTTLRYLGVAKQVTPWWWLCDFVFQLSRGTGVAQAQNGLQEEPGSTPCQWLSLAGSCPQARWCSSEAGITPQRPPVARHGGTHL